MTFLLWAVLTFTWNCVTTDINGGPESIDRYCIFWGRQSAIYDNFICASFAGCFWTIGEDNFLFNTPYYFAVSAIDLANNESTLSNEVVYIRQQPPFNGGSGGGSKKIFGAVSKERKCLPLSDVHGR